MEANQAAGRKYIILAIVLTGVFMSVVDGIVVGIALPTITGHFHVSMARSQWTITAYLLTLTSLLLICGRISQTVGKTILFKAGFTVFTLGSLACGFSTNLTMLIVFRVLQAIGGAMVFSISGAIIYQTFPPRERGRAMGYLGSTVAVGSIAGPILGGLLVDALGWRYIFFLNVPIGIIVVAAAQRYLNLHEEDSRRFALDWVGALSFIFLLLSLMLFLGTLAEPAGKSELLIAMCLLAVLFLAVFIWHERRHPEPLLDLRLFQNTRFLLPLLCMVLTFMAGFMLGVVGPFYLQGVMRFRPSQVGLIYMVVPCITIVAAPVSGWLYDKHHSPLYAAGGLIVLSFSYFLLGYAALLASLAGLVLAFVFNGFGGALFQSPNNTEVMNALPRQNLAIGSSLIATMRNLGMSLGVSLASILVSSQLSHAGFTGNILHAEPHLLARVISRVFQTAGALIVIAALIALAGLRAKRGRI